MPTAEEIAAKRFDQEDKQWDGPRFLVLGFFTLLIAITTIFLMSRTTGCSLQIVP